MLDVLTMIPASFSRLHPELIHRRPFPISLAMDRQFPPEIVQLIVEASLDPYILFQYANVFKARYSILKSYSVLNSTWRAFSEPLLYRWVDLSSEELALKFLEIAEERGGQ